MEQYSNLWKIGEVLFMDDSDQCNRLTKRLCIKSSHSLLVFASILVTLNNVTYVILVRELCSWNPTFIGNGSDSDEASSIGMFKKQGDKLFEENDVESIVEIMDDPRTGADVHEQDMEVKADVPVTTTSDMPDGLNNLPVDSDPFGLGPLINKKPNKGLNLCHSDTPKFPSGFSPINDDQQTYDSIHKLSGRESIKKASFSLLKRLEETIKVGLALGLNMKGCEKTLASLIADKGGIVESKMSQADLWMLRQVDNYLCPQNLSSKIALWSSLSNLTATWDDIMVMMGDFNEVREASVVLEKGIPDHRHILLKESQVDYRPTLFRFFHSWMKMEGFQNLVVETWNNEAIVNANGLRDHKKRLSSIDVKIDHGNDSEEDFKNRRDSLTFLGVLDRMVARDLAQKAKIKWALEGDENTSFFHGCNSSFIALIPKVSNANSVFDFRPTSLIGCQYKFIDKLLANRLSIVIEDCISPVQSAFIKGRNILDGPLILNEVMAWYRQRKKELMVFKVDFEKAFDSMRWDFLDLILNKLGFSLKWRTWIKGCLHNSRSSVLVNGSPTEEFKLFRGLRQGDPVSLFFFILAMEGLHALTCKAEALGLFKVASIGRYNLSISHLMHADDVIFFGEWS
ncbi:RNA-directed DNA polymerase, eukaryota, reverse transcriptase zinc-binding domain protein [Tanacetum coccineum]